MRRKPVYGLVFLFQYEPAHEDEQQVRDSEAQIWFANQARLFTAKRPGFFDYPKSNVPSIASHWLTLDFRRQTTLAPQ